MYRPADAQSEFRDMCATDGDVEEREPITPGRLEEDTAQVVENALWRPSYENKIGILTNRDNPSRAGTQIFEKGWVALGFRTTRESSELFPTNEIPAERNAHAAESVRA
jgi:hypothetical protein